MITLITEQLQKQTLDELKCTRFSISLVKDQSSCFSTTPPPFFRGSLLVLLHPCPVLYESWYLYWKSPLKAQKTQSKRKGAGIFPLIEKGHQNLGGEGFEIVKGVHYFTH